MLAERSGHGVEYLTLSYFMACIIDWRHGYIALHAILCLG